MRNIRAAGFILIVIAAFSAGVWYRGRNESVSETASNNAGILKYICPMHPQYVSNRPGDCPSCGMRLVPADRDASHDGRAENSEPGLPPGLYT